MPKISEYTQGNYIGKVGDFSGQYEDTHQYYVNSNDSVYTSNETADVLIVVRKNGTIVTMVSSDWSLKKYEPERLEPDYVDPDDVPFE